MSLITTNSISRHRADSTRVRQLEREVANLHEELQRNEQEQSRLLSELLSVQEEERKRIARELHDEIGQTLASRNASLEAVASMLPADAEKPRNIIRKTQALSVRLLDDIDRLIYDLRPSLLDDMGLVAALRWLSEESLSASGLHVEFRVDGRQRRLQPQLETTLFRVIQEACSNIVRHSRARKAKVALRFEEGAVAATVSDDGRGFDVHGTIGLTERRSGLGLLGMRERVELAHGAMTIRSKPGAGTEIRIAVPALKVTSPADGETVCDPHSTQ